MSNPLEKNQMKDGENILTNSEKDKVNNIPTDTNTVLASKADNAAVVDKTSNQTINGIKTFAVPPAFPDGSNPEHPAKLKDLGNVPVGTEVMWSNVTPPSGWLKQDGAAYNTTTYAALFSHYGWDHTPVLEQGGSIFRVPDMAGLLPRGLDTGKGIDPDAATRTNVDGDVVGDIVGSLQDDEFKSHFHESSISTAPLDQPEFNLGSTHLVNDGTITGSNTETSSTDLAGGSETRPKNMSKIFIVKY